uniref:BAALC binder of MAP3K1 and KLF4 n=1 Tax=Apteryx owenii TaxID=8824 RepID=A0A8B9NWD3_APTOW
MQAALCVEAPRSAATIATVISCYVVLITQFHLSLLGILEDGKSAQTGVTTASITTGILNTEKKPSCGAQCANPTVPATGAVAQRPSSFRTAESKWDTKKMPTKEVTINVAKSIRQSDRRIAKNCVN